MWSCICVDAFIAVTEAVEINASFFPTGVWEEVLSPEISIRNQALTSKLVIKLVIKF